MSAALNRNPQDIIYRLLDACDVSGTAFREIGLGSERWTLKIKAAARDLFDAGLTAWRIGALFGVDFEGVEKALYAGRADYGHAKRNPFAICTDHKQDTNREILAAVGGTPRVLDAFAGEGRFAAIVEDLFPGTQQVCIEKDASTYDRARSLREWATSTRWILDSNIEVMKQLATSGKRFDVIDLDPFVSCRDQIDLTWPLLEDQGYLFVTFGGEYRRSFIRTNRKAIQRRYGFCDSSLSNSEYLEVVPSFFLGWLAAQASAREFVFEIERCVRYPNNCRFWLRANREPLGTSVAWLNQHSRPEAGGVLWNDLRLPRFSELRKEKLAKKTDSNRTADSIAEPRDARSSHRKRSFQVARSKWRLRLGMTNQQTIYGLAREQMSEIVVDLLKLARLTKNFTKPPKKVWSNTSQTEMLLCGKGYHIEDISELPSQENAWLGRLAVPFSIELAATGMLYKRLRVFSDDLIKRAFAETEKFTKITPDWINANSHFLPVMMHVAGAFSKQELKKQIGSATDRAISRPASRKLALLLTRTAGAIPNQKRVQERIKGTVEGIVRDLVGRLLLEQFVASALKRHKVPFKREEDYETLEGVVYNFRADFVIPNPEAPKAFLEVRKSSSRHASLYAKDKMFSAINWKGQHKRCLGVLVIDGPWTDVTLRILARVFDYVIPIGQVDEVAAKIREYLDGDESVLQWLIRFRIMRNRPGGEPVPAEKVELEPEEILAMETNMEE